MTTPAPLVSASAKPVGVLLSVTESRSPFTVTSFESLSPSFRLSLLEG